MSTEDIIKKRGRSIPLKTPLSQQIRKSIYQLIFTLLAIIVLVSIAYLLNSSQATQKGYSLNQEQLEKDQLTETTRDLVGKIIQAQSYKTLENNDLVKKMIKPDQPIYLENLPAKK